MKLFPIVLVIILIVNRGFAGEIHRFTDSQGILHISNIETTLNPESENFKKSVLPGGLPGKGPAIPSAFDPAPQREGSEPDLVSLTAATPRGRLGTQPHNIEELFQCVYEVAKELEARIDLDGRPLPIEGALCASLPAHPVSSSLIRNYKDPQGIIHIASNPERGAKPTIQMPMELWPEQKSMEPNSDQPEFRQIAWSGSKEVLAAPPSTTSFAPLLDAVGNTSRRYLGYQGEPCNTNKLPQKICAPSMASLIQTGSVPVTTSAPAQMGLISIPADTMGQPADVLLHGAGPQTIIARRDQRGICHIYNLAAADLGRDRENPSSLLGKLSPDLEPIIAEAAQLYRLPVSLILALIRYESNFAPQAISPKGAMGLMQLMPGTATFLGVQDPFSSQENILGGCRYFRYLLDYFQGSVPLALAAYNAGSQRVISAGYQIPPIKETQRFVTQVINLYYVLDKLFTLSL